LITEEEFAVQRRALLDEERRVDEHIALAQQGDPWFEPAETVVWFSNRATRWYRYGNDQVRRTIVRAVGSNLVLMEKEVSIEARKPFVLLRKGATCSNLLAVLDEIRTLYEQKDPEFMETLSLIQEIKKLGEPPRRASQSRPPLHPATDA
jgi:hypothetical protein